MNGFVWVVAGAILTVFVSMGGVLFWQASKLDTANATIALEAAKLDSCGGRLAAVLRDVRSDNEIDDLDLLEFDVPADWMLPSGTTYP